jgi:O-antigen/teichoic acid export membrane protein
MAAAAMLLGLSDLFAEAGVGRALVQKKEVTDDDSAGAFTLSLILSAACYAFLLAGTPWAARFWKTPELTAVLPVMGALVLLVPFRTVALGLLDRRLSLRSQGVQHVASSALQAATVLALALRGAGYWALVAGVVLARVFDTLSLALMAAWRPRLTGSLRGSGGLLRFGLWVSGGSFLWYFYSNSDYAVVGRLEGPVVLGYYSLAFQLMTLPVQKVTANINQVAFPVFCRLQSEPERLTRWYLRLTALMIAVVLPTLLGAALVADDGLSSAFGVKWQPAVEPFRVLCVVGLLGVVSSSLVSLVNALGRPDVHFKYTAACALVFPPAFVLAGSRFGLLGVCWAWVFVSALAVSLLVAASRGITGVGLGSLLLAQWPAAQAGSLMALAVLAVRLSLGSSVPTPARLAASIFVGALTYSLALLFTARDTVVADFKTLLREMKSAK